MLARRINQPLLILYGLGTILGAGIYVLVGKVAAEAGLLAPLSFIFAAFIAWLTALSYSKLVVLFPKSAGEAVYIEHSFGKKWLTLTVGILIILTGVVSAATLTNGFIGYLLLLIPVNETIAMISIVVVLTMVAVWGIAESLMLAALITVIEVMGLLIVLAFCGDVLLQLPEKLEQLFVPTSVAQFTGVLSGAFLAFYAFIGFEDMVNVVEEVKQPQRTMPRAIFWVVLVSTSLYVLIALVAIFSLPLEDLSHSNSPLADMLAQRSFGAAKVVSVISVFAIVNGVLIQLIMASRVCYGMSKQYGGPVFLHRVSLSTQTPVFATLTIGVAILIFALFFPLVVLAKFTSFIILIIFALVNLALWKLQRGNYQDASKESITYIGGLKSYPILAAILCIGMLVFQISHY
ncbi:amino acid permease [Zhongshania borealis]|uniref:Amino acid permease n=1 Tax=Zhongshania borealis TaxID=889488 RepID=A0ABP7WFT3_9GAMM